MSDKKTTKRDPSCKVTQVSKGVFIAPFSIKKPTGEDFFKTLPECDKLHRKPDRKENKT